MFTKSQEPAHLRFGNNKIKSLFYVYLLLVIGQNRRLQTTNPSNRLAPHCGTGRRPAAMSRRTAQRINSQSNEGTINSVAGQVAGRSQYSERLRLGVPTRLNGPIDVPASQEVGAATHNAAHGERRTTDGGTKKEETTDKTRWTDMTKGKQTRTEGRTFRKRREKEKKRERVEGRKKRLKNFRQRILTVSDVTYSNSIYGPRQLAQRQLIKSPCSFLRDDSRRFGHNLAGHRTVRGGEGRGGEERRGVYGSISASAYRIQRSTARTGSSLPRFDITIHIIEFIKHIFSIKFSLRISVEGGNCGRR